MSIPNKDRFSIKDLEEVVLEESEKFPPEQLSVDKAGKITLLGKSNKIDLEPINISTLGLQKAAMDGNIGQFIYTNDSGDLFDIYLYVNEVKQVVVYGKRTRELPDKKSSKKKEA